MLFAMAVFVWILPLAAIYPPSALTVSSQRFTYIKNLNVSTWDVSQPTYNPWGASKIYKTMLGLAESTMYLSGGYNVNVTLSAGYRSGSCIFLLSETRN
jgi:hypothetical protein